MTIIEEIPELEDLLEMRGMDMVRYLATRIVYFELKQDLFEKMYFSREGSTCSTTFATILASREDGFLSLAKQIPDRLLEAFIVGLITNLAQAWVYVVLDYARRRKKDNFAEHIEDDQDQLTTTKEHLLSEVDRRAREGREAATTAQAQGRKGAGGQRTELDMDRVHKQLSEPIGLTHALLLKMQDASTEEAARVANFLFGEEEEVARQRSASPIGRRGRSPSINAKSRTSSHGPGGATTPPPPSERPSYPSESFQAGAQSKKAGHGKWLRIVGGGRPK